MNIIKEKTCAITGHRIIKRDLDLEKLKQTFLKLIESGFDTFLCGMALGFDTLCFKILYSIKRQKNLDIKIIACIPCQKQDIGYNESQKIEYQKMLDVADEKIYVSNEYSKTCMMKRNMFMVDNAFCLIAYLNQERGGTKNTVEYAKKSQKPIIFV